MNWSQLPPLTVSIKRHILSSKLTSTRRLQPHPPPVAVMLAPPPSTTDTTKSSASRVKKLLARFGGGGGGGAGGGGGGGAFTPSGGSSSQGQIEAPPTSYLTNPRKRELDLSDLSFSGPQSKRLKQEEVQV